MREEVFEIRFNGRIGGGFYRMELAGDTSAMTAPGQFVELALPGRFLRRPFSAADWDEQSLTLIYRVAGEGTADMAALEPGTRLSLLVGLGNGFDLKMAGQNPLLVGGGAGAAPLLGLCRRLMEQGAGPRVLLGFNTAADVICLEQFKVLGACVELATLDGSAGRRGFAHELMEGVPSSCCYACGPLPMLRAVEGAMNGPGQLSLEARMACGFGVCMGCTIATKKGPKRVCADGPVFERGQVIW